MANRTMATAALKTTPKPSGQIAIVSELVDASDIQFGCTKKSPYDTHLAKLNECDPSEALCMRGCATKKAAIMSRAKKLGLRVAAAIVCNDLYLKPAAPKPTTAPKPDRMSLTDAVRQVVAEQGPLSNQGVKDAVMKLRPDTTRESIDGTLVALQRRGEIAKGDDLKWRPAKKA